MREELDLGMMEYVRQRTPQERRKKAMLKARGLACVPALVMAIAFSDVFFNSPGAILKALVVIVCAAHIVGTLEDLWTLRR